MQRNLVWKRISLPRQPKGQKNSRRFFFSKNFSENSKTLRLDRGHQPALSSRARDWTSRSFPCRDSAEMIENEHLTAERARMNYVEAPSVDRVQIGALPSRPRRRVRKKAANGSPVSGIGKRTSDIWAPKTGTSRLHC